MMVLRVAPPHLLHPAERIRYLILILHPLECPAMSNNELSCCTMISPSERVLGVKSTSISFGSCWLFCGLTAIYGIRTEMMVSYSLNCEQRWPRSAASTTRSPNTRPKVRWMKAPNWSHLHAGGRRLEDPGNTSVLAAGGGRKSLSRCDMELTGCEETAPIGLKHDTIPLARLAYGQVTAEEGPDWPRLHVDTSILATGKDRKSSSRCDMEPTGYEDTAPIGPKHDAIPHVRVAYDQVTVEEGPAWPRLHVDLRILSTLQF